MQGTKKQHLALPNYSSVDESIHCGYLPYTLGTLSTTLYRAISRAIKHMAVCPKYTFNYLQPEPYNRKYALRNTITNTYKHSLQECLFIPTNIHL